MSVWFKRVFLSVAILGFLGAGSASAQGLFDPPGLNRAIAVADFHSVGLLERQGVVGAGVGLDASGRAAIVIMTRGPGVAGLPRSLDGVPVLVKVTGPIHANPKPNCSENSSHPSCKDSGDGSGGGEEIDPTARFDRAVPIGVSTGNMSECSSGTIGARVTDGFGAHYALSNNHVYAAENAADLGSTVLQPGRFDTNCVSDAGDAIGTLADFVDIVFSTSASNEVDAAIAHSNEVWLGNATLSDGYGTPSSTTAVAYINQKVQKYGRSTGLTTGKVTMVNVTVDVGYSSGVARFVNQIVIERRKRAFLMAGDSGSLVVTDDEFKNPVGLLFAGNSNGRLGVANPIDLVLDALDVSIDDQ